MIGMTMADVMAAGRVPSDGSGLGLSRAQA